MTAQPLMQTMHNAVGDSVFLEASFDVHSLSSKLETATREQNAARERRKKRESLRNGDAYFPRNAATQLIATTSSMNDRALQSLNGNSQPAQRRHSGQKGASGPVAEKEGKRSSSQQRPLQPHGTSNPKRMVAAMSLGMSESEASANFDDFTTRSASPALSQQHPRPGGLQMKILPIKSGSDIVTYQHVGLGASSQSTNNLTTTKADLAPSSSQWEADLSQIDLTRLMFGHGQEGRKSGEHRSERPKLVPNSWAQSSECEDDYRKRRTSSNERKAKAAKRKAAEGSEGVPSPERQGSLVADAVAIIKEEQRSKRNAFKTIFRWS